MLLLIDNYDSFTHNVAGMLATAGADVQVVRNDVATVDELLARRPDRIVISPGPGRPQDAGVSIELVHAAHRHGIPLLGICLGMQAIAAAFGGDIVRLTEVVHGEASAVHHDDSGVFEGLPQGFAAGRYHSLVADERTLPSELVVTARTDDGILMGIRHEAVAIEGVQFHPESILTPRGGELLARFLTSAGARPAEVVA